MFHENNLLKLLTSICSVLPVIFIFSFFNTIEAQVSERKVSVFRDSTDNKYDISDWLIHKKGVLLVPTLITEPAVGYGISLAAVYFHSSYTEKNGPPSMSGVVAGATQNGTWVAGLFHVGYWKQDRLRYMGGIIRTNANLGFYGSGYSAILANEPINLNLNAWGLVQQLKGRIGNSGFFAGGRYLLFKTDNTFEVPVDYPEFSGTDFKSTLSEASLILNYDSRNNVFSPSKGFYITSSGTYSDEWFGGDALYGRLSFEALGWFPASKRVNVGLRYGSNYTMGDVPIYARPIVQLRGAPITKYQNKNTTLMETEISVDLYKRWSMVGFAGIGNAYESLSEFEKGKSVRTAGTGLRYLLARKFGVKMGVDFAASQDDYGIYIVFGSSWLR